LVNTSDAVLLTVAMLQHICHPTQKYYMQLVALYFNKLNARDGFHEWMWNFKKMPSKTLADGMALQQDFRLFLLRSGVELDYQKMGTLPLYELVSYISMAFQLSTSDSKLATFNQYVFEFGLKIGTTVYDLLDDWELKQEELSIQLPDDFDAVNLLTIHKSKGLDWPVVIMYNLNEKGKSSSFWVELPEGNDLPVAYLSLKDLERLRYDEPKEEEQRMRMLDYVNLLYVGCTRAADRLHVLCALPAENLFKEINTPFFDTFKQLNAEVEYQDVTVKKVVKEMPVRFTFGTFEPVHSTAPKAVEDTDKFLTLPNVKSSVYQQKLKVKKNYLSRLSAQNEIDFGNMIHKAFSYVLDASQVGEAVQQLVHLGDIQQKDAAAVAELMQQVVNHLQLQEYFSSGNLVRTEAELVLPTGEILIPDRVVETPTHMAVIDFKTGMPNAKYTEQILAYMNELKHMGYKNVKGYLVYTATMQVQEV
jgi:ATP-dependent exoDNAse (exonuclease V) beta subunit